MEPAFPSTFSIAAYDPDAQQWGVAVQSKFLAVGWIVPWAYWGVGAVATQSRANATFGPRGLGLMRDGLNAEEALRRLLDEDEHPEIRQVGLVDERGLAAAHTGEGCDEWAGHLVGDGYCCQGNTLARSAVVHEMASGFEGARGQLADRLMQALIAGQEAGGDRRGQQSAALYVVAENEGHRCLDHRYIDLRIDDGEQPIEALGELLFKFKVTFHRTTRHDVVPWSQGRAKHVAQASALQPYLRASEGRSIRQLQAALSRFARASGVRDPELDAGIDGRLWRLLR